MVFINKVEKAFNGSIINSRKLTKGMKAILLVLIEEGDYLTHSEVHTELAKRGIKLDRSRMYVTFDLLFQNGFLEVDFIQVDVGVSLPRKLKMFRPSEKTLRLQ